MRNAGVPRRLIRRRLAGPRAAARDAARSAAGTAAFVRPRAHSDGEVKVLSDQTFIDQSRP
jgi:hypothetical protein